MSHTRWEERLSPLLDGELPQDEARGVREHVERCSECRERLDQLARLSRSIQSLPCERIPEDLKTAVLREAGDGAAPVRRAAARPFAIASLAGAALVAIVAVVAIRREAPTEPSVVESAAREAPAPEQPTVIASGGRPSSDEPTRETKRLEADELSKRAEVAPRDRRLPPSKVAEYKQRTDQRKIARPSPPRTKDEAPPQEQAEMKRAGGIVARYSTVLLMQDDGVAALAQIVPQPEGAAGNVAGAAPGPQALAAPDAGLTVREEAGRSAMLGSAQSQAARTLAERRGPAARLTFWVSIGPDGRILSVQSIGARDASEAVVDAVASLLKVASVPPLETRAGMAAVIEVTLPPAPTH